MLDLLIINGTVVNAESSQTVDVGVKDGKIVALGKQEYMPAARKVIDAAGKYVIPGMIDSHVHVNTELGEFTTTDDFYNASLAAAYGGTTTMIEFAIPNDQESPVDALNRRLEEAKNNTVIDYSFHGCVTKGNAQSYQDVQELITGGVPTIKMFTVYKDLVMLDKGSILEVLKLVKRYGGLAKIHAENSDIIDASIRKYVSEQKTGPVYHAKSRPAIAEIEAMASVIALVECTEAPALFVHMSTHQGKALLTAARDRLPIFTEVCSHYLSLTEDKYAEEGGQNFICSPPIRSQEEQDGLWDMVRQGAVDVINSDHCCYTLDQKQKYADFFPKAPNGLPGIETRGTILYSEGVAKGRISVNEFVRLTSAKTAQLMGLYPRKGIIQVGSDADIAVIDPQAEYILTNSQLHMNTDYTPFEGLHVTGKVVDVVSRGVHLLDNGTLAAPSARGSFVKRRSPILT